MSHLIASAVLAGYYIKLTKVQLLAGYGYQVDYGADSQTYGSFKAASRAFKYALDHAEWIAYDYDMGKS